MSKEIFNPSFALFISVPDGGSTFQPNPNSVIHNDTIANHIDFFKFVGRVVGKAVHDGQVIEAYFTRSFYKQKLSYKDIEGVDPEYYSSIKWIIENDITGIIDMNFTVDWDFFGK